MALEDILRKITGEAQAQAQEILRSAQAERERLMAEADLRAKASVERIEAAGKAASEEARRKELSTASVEVRRTLLSAKQEVLAQVFEQALDSLTALPEAEYRTLLAGLAANAAVTGSEQVVVSARDRQRLGDEFLAMANERLAARGLAAKLTYAAGARNLRGGLILSSGEIEINCSFERTLASLRDDLEPVIASMLFEGIQQEAAR
jgi:V/A-type H+-transporting ATPase subunit E